MDRAGIRDKTHFCGDAEICDYNNSMISIGDLVVILVGQTITMSTNTTKYECIKHATWSDDIAMVVDMFVDMGRSLEIEDSIGDVKIQRFGKIERVSSRELCIVR